MNADILFTLWMSDFKSFESFFQIISTRLFSFSLLFLFSIYFFFKKKFWVFVLKSLLKLKINLEKTKPQIKVATIEGSLNENSDIPNTKIEMH